MASKDTAPVSNKKNHNVPITLQELYIFKNQKVKHGKVSLMALQERVPAKIPESSKAPVTSQVEAQTCKRRKCNVTITLQKVPDKVTNQNQTLKCGKVNSMASEDRIPTKVSCSSKVPVTSQDEVLGCKRNHNVPIIVDEVNISALQNSVPTKIQGSSKVPVASQDEVLGCRKRNPNVPITSIQEVNICKNQQEKLHEVNETVLQDRVPTEIPESKKAPVTSQAELAPTCLRRKHNSPITSIQEVYIDNNQQERLEEFNLTAIRDSVPTNIPGSSKVPVASQDEVPTYNRKVCFVQISLKEVPDKVIDQKQKSGKVNSMASENSVSTSILQKKKSLDTDSSIPSTKDQGKHNHQSWKKVVVPVKFATFLTIYYCYFLGPIQWMLYQSMAILK